MRTKNKVCAYCKAPVEKSTFSIHRDGFGDGPEVPLCLDCGSHELPTCEQIWARISTKKNPKTLSTPK